MKPEINDDDFNALEYEHAQALREIEQFSLANFAKNADALLVALQDNAYQLGLERGKKESKQ